MSEDLLAKLAKLDEAEALLSCTSVRGIANGFRTQMDLNKMILDGARSALDTPAGDKDGEGDER